MTKATSERAQPPIVSYPIFAAVYERMTHGSMMRGLISPLRTATAGQTYGVVLEIGAGTGLNFAHYLPGQVARVEANEPDAAMLRYARKRVEMARVPITLTRAPAEALPFAEATFDSAVATLVFCSVTDLDLGLREVYRVLKPGGALFLAEHVRAQGAFQAGVQDALVPLTTRLSGNCHWNRDTVRAVADVGFQIEQERLEGGGLFPMSIVRASKSPTR